MAYVAVSKTLIGEVKQCIRRLRDAEVGQMGDYVSLLTATGKRPEIMELIVTELWAKEADLRERLSKYSKERSVYVTVKRDDMELEIPVTVAAPCFLQIREYSAYKMTLRPELTHHFEACLDTKAAHDEANKRWNNVADQVTQFLDTCKSVNEAVKLWPDVRRYLPREAVDKLDAKTEKQTRDMTAVMNALKSIDMDAVSAGTVLARMAGARI